MKIVLDTNVIVAGLLSPFSPCGDIIRMVAAGNLTLLVDARVLSEYQEVLKRPKFHFDPDKVASFLDYIAHISWVISSVPLSASLPDVDDEPFLEIAISGNADYLVTGNTVHFPFDACRGVKVVSPSDFVKQVMKQKKGKKTST